jgi:hypothetical protein
LLLYPQANSEVSALLGRIPSAVGYQPTLATDLGGLQERITTTTKGSITSVQVRGWCNMVYSAFHVIVQFVLHSHHHHHQEVHHIRAGARLVQHGVQCFSSDCAVRVAFASSPPPPSFHHISAGARLVEHGVQCLSSDRAVCVVFALPQPPPPTARDHR